ncbi:MAG: type ISP restriction/modification enzyme [Promethearchaeota archaeon]
MTVVDQLSFSRNALNEYVRKIERLIESEVANEESFYADFRDLLKDFFNTEEFEVMIVPKTEEKKDKPDFIVYMDNIPIIHIEGKKPYDPVDKWLLADTSNRLFDQVYRFRGREDNNIPVMVTDFIHIWVIDKDSSNSKDSDHQVKSRLKIIDDNETSWKVFSGIKSNLETVLNYLCEDIAVSITKISSIIPHLVKYARKLKIEIMEVFKEPDNPMRNYLENIRNDFLESIFSSDKERKSQEFADLFAQTLIYGSFISWMRFCKEGNSPDNFSFRKATDYLPYGTFIYNIFADMSTKSSPDIRKKIFEKIERIFKSSQFEKITKNTETLMITFYSDFLQKYDPEMAKDRGIVYTPHPIVSFITKGIDYFLKKYFDKPEGVCSSNITFLDPAAGTMAFPCEVLRLGRNFFENKFSKQLGRINAFFKEWTEKVFLNNSYAFEILMAPYVLGHLRTNMLLEELGAKIDPTKERVNFYLFNTLMELQTTLKDFRNPVIGTEIVEALNVRNKKPILVVMGNPPYNISSQNKFKWIEDKIEDYKEEIQRVGTKEISSFKALQDDYVKFIRFAQWKIKQKNSGIVAFITNNYYLDGITFRGMRYCLQKDFNKIWIVNLNGDMRKDIPKRIIKCGIKSDENVFGDKTSVGIAIVFFIRTPDHTDEECRIRYVEKWGLKEEKYSFLEYSIEELKFQKIVERENYEMIPDEFLDRGKYQSFTYIVDIFKKNIQGIITGHDSEIIDISRKETKEKIQKLFKKYSNPPQTPTKTWNRAWILETSEENAISRIIEWNWRGFDRRFISFDTKLIGRASYQIMQYLIPPNRDNLTLIINRQNRSDLASSYFITDTVFDNKCLEGAKGLKCYAFPLKINISEEDDDIFNPKPGIDSNINQDFKQELVYGNSINDYDIFFYIYAILYTPIYRDTYYLGLMEDFPRIPFPDSKELLIEMSDIGKRLVTLHILKANDLNTTQFPMSKSVDYKIHYIRKNDKDRSGSQIPDTYDPSTKRIYFKKRTTTQINLESRGDNLDDITWIGGISQKMWDFEVGGRQQLKEWLYDRRYSSEPKSNTISRPLSNDELDYFLKMCDAIKKTIELLPKLDEIYKKIDP